MLIVTSILLKDPTEERNDYLSSLALAKHEYFHSGSVFWRMQVSYHSTVALKMLVGINEQQEESFWKQGHLMEDPRRLHIAWSNRLLVSSGCWPESRFLAWLKRIQIVSLIHINRKICFIYWIYWMWYTLSLSGHVRDGGEHVWLILTISIVLAPCGAGLAGLQNGAGNVANLNISDGKLLLGTSNFLKYFSLKMNPQKELEKILKGP